MAAITSVEFAHLLQACRPPCGWGTSITVALSGGPDSLGLLSLLRNHCPALPLRSITIDHGLQPTSYVSAMRTHERAIAMGVPNVVLHAEWVSPVESGRAFEEVARDARYRALWHGLWNGDELGPRTLMFAHHADDQLETVLMRVLRGTGAYGMGGMRALRRWGMVKSKRLGEVVGDDTPLRGMNTWLCRPLLSLPKDRILATCAAHDLEYEVDQTNFMPDLTVRNALRHALAGHRTTRSELVGAINRVHILSGGAPDSPPDVACMRTYVERMSIRVREVDDIVSTYLLRHTRPSPPSTLLLTPSNLHTLPNDASHALVHRILRYISPHPWGSVQSEGGRKTKSVQRILDALQSGAALPFTAGAQVLWTPVIVRSDGSIRARTGQDGVEGWLITRLAPPRDMSLDVQATPGSSVLWDNRFLVRIPALPHDQMFIRPTGRYIVPRVVCVLRDGSENDVHVESTFVRELSAI